MITSEALCALCEVLSKKKDEHEGPAGRVTFLKSSHLPGYVCFRFSCGLRKGVGPMDKNLISHGLSHVGFSLARSVYI